MQNPAIVWASTELIRSLLMKSRPWVFSFANHGSHVHDLTVLSS